MLRETFFIHLFFLKTKTLSLIVQVLSFGLLNPVMSAKKKYQISQQGSVELIWAMIGGGALFNANHLLELGEERRYGKKDRDNAKEAKLKGLVQ